LNLFDVFDCPANDQNIASLPKVDHTLGTFSGHFLFVRAYTTGDSAWLLSRIFAPTAGKNCQMRLFFYVYGSNLNDLSVKYRTHSSGPANAQLWSSSGQQVCLK
jgi:hypothetical protein